MTYSLAGTTLVIVLKRSDMKGKLTLVSVVGDTGVVASVGSRECNEVAGRSAAAAGNLKLVASGVELSARVLVGSVESDGLVTDDVVAGLDAGGNGIVDGLAVNDSILQRLVGGDL